MVRQERIYCIGKGEDIRGHYIIIGLPTGDSKVLHVSKEIHDRTMVN